MHVGWRRNALQIGCEYRYEVRCAENRAGRLYEVRWSGRGKLVASTKTGGDHGFWDVSEIFDICALIARGRDGKLPIVDFNLQRDPFIEGIQI